MLSRRSFLKALPITAGAALVALRLAPVASAQPGRLTTALTRDGRMFGLPFAAPSGPNSWLLHQLYGNTQEAYDGRYTTYILGQGLHFGVDFSCP